MTSSFSFLSCIHSLLSFSTITHYSLPSCIHSFLSFSTTPSFNRLSCIHFFIRLEWFFLFLFFLAYIPFFCLVRLLLFLFVPLSFLSFVLHDSFFTLLSCNHTFLSFLMTSFSLPSCIHSFLSFSTTLAFSLFSCIHSSLSFSTTLSFLFLFVKLMVLYVLYFFSFFISFYHFSVFFSLLYPITLHSVTFLPSFYFAFGFFVFPISFSTSYVVYIIKYLCFSQSLTSCALKWPDKAFIFSNRLIQFLFQLRVFLHD